MKKSYCCRFTQNIFANVTGALLFIVFLSLTTYSAENEPEVPKQGSSLQGITRIKCDSSGITITIDGIDKEWETNRATVINKNTAIGCHKDDDFLYVHLLTSDPEFSMQMMNFGLTLWLDTKGSQKKAVGVQFPVIQLQPPPPKEGGKPPMGEELKKFLNTRLKDIIIEFPGNKDMKQMSMAEANSKHGIDAIIGVDEKKGTICYELKYPLHKSSSTDKMGIDLKRQKSMDICIETPEIDPSKLKEKYEKTQVSADDGKPQDASVREPRPPKSSEEPKPPKPTKKPPMGRISQWIRVSL